MKIKTCYKWIIIFISISFLAGCHHMGWKSGRDETVDRNLFNIHTRVVAAGNFEEAKRLGLLYKQTQEPPNTRYYFNWNSRCQYSLLVAPDGEILSWALVDYKKRKECVNYQKNS